MFQKLYRHLEDIKSSLQRDNANTDAVQVGGKVIEQLENLNARLDSLQRQSRRGVTGVLVVVALSCIVVVFMHFDQRLRNDRAILPHVAVGSSPGAAEQDQAEKRMLIQHLGALDSLIAGQARSIQELKELNTTSVATFRRIRRHFYLMESAGVKTPPASVTNAVSEK